jgi:hypothetical protein
MGRSRAIAPWNGLAGGSLNCAEACDLFESEQRQIGRNVLTPRSRMGHWEEIKKLRKELSLARPYYLPHFKAPPD